MAENNIIQWNPDQNNMETDATYQSDSQRSGGAVNGVFSPELANKLFYQCTTPLAALALALSTKGYPIVDGSTPYTAAGSPSTAVSNLAATLAYLMTAVDVISEVSIGSESGYIVFGPTLGGLIIEWGGTGSIATGSHVISFASDFQHNVPAVVLSPGSGSITQYSATPVGLDNFTVNVTGTGALFFIAIGS